MEFDRVLSDILEVNRPWFIREMATAIFIFGILTLSLKSLIVL